MFLPENSILVVIDIQGKLAQLMHARDALFLQVSKLVRAAALLDIPIIVTEQVPAKIGRTQRYSLADLNAAASPDLPPRDRCIMEERPRRSGDAP